MKLKKRKQQIDDDEQKIIDDYEEERERVRRLKSNLASSNKPILDNWAIESFERRDIKKEYRASLKEKMNAGEGTLAIKGNWTGEVLKPEESDHLVRRKCGCGRTDLCNGQMHFGYEKTLKAKPYPSHSNI